MSRKIVILSILSILAFISCEENEEGCLDLLSDNFNFNAVTECDECCTYPSAILNFRVDYDTFLSRALLDTFFLDNLNSDTLFLNNIQLATGVYTFTTPAEPYQVLGSLSFNGVDVRDDYVLIETPTAVNIGNVRFAGQTDNVEFNIGIDQTTVDSWGFLDNIDQTSRLDRLLDNMYEEAINEVAMMRLSLQVGDSIRQLSITSPNSLLLNRVIDKFNEPSDDLSFSLRVDLKILTEGLDPQLSDEEMEALIADKLEDSIRLE